MSECKNCSCGKDHLDDCVCLRTKRVPVSKKEAIERCISAEYALALEKSESAKMRDALDHSHRMFHVLLGKRCDGACIAAYALAESETGKETK